MHVNGRPYAYREGLTLHALLTELKLDQRTVSVMHGDDIHRAGRIPDSPLAERDVIEIVTMMQGG
ncbi:MAG: sulfur carrier protein ThiS [Gemmatimonadaceae bacterium]